MRLAAAVLAVVVVAPVADLDARTTKVSSSGKKRGKVVRVERGRSERLMDPRWCQIRPDGSATCYGKGPDIGMEGAVVDEIGRKATVRVMTVTPQLDSCGNVVSTEITTQTTSGDVSMSNYAWAALFDYKATANTRTVYNNGQIQVPSSARGPGVESVWTAFDDDNDNNADFIISYYNCDATGQVSTTGYGGYCMVYYTRGGSLGGFSERRVDIIRQC